MGLLKRVNQVLCLFGRGAEIYLELIWTIILGILTVVCLGLTSDGGVQKGAKALVVLHVGGLFYIVAKRPYERFRNWQFNRKLKNIDRIQNMVQDLDTEELRDQAQMMINQLSRDEKLTLLQDLGRSVMQEK